MKQAKTKYIVQKAGAKRRGVPFLLTFEEWWDIWQQSGKWEQRGRYRGQYVMSRYADKGSYEVGNVFIQTVEHNVREAQIGNNTPRGPMSDEHKKKLSIARTGLKMLGVSKLKGRPQSEEHKMKNRMAQLKRNAEKKLMENIR